MMHRRVFIATVAVGLFGGSPAAWAATPTRQPTVIQVEAIHCSSCAKKITKKLSEVTGVLTAKADIKRNLALVAADKSKTPSPRAMWEAVEVAGFKPVKLTCPSGIYTSKPNK